jgi:excisionase family DNA binding protein
VGYPEQKSRNNRMVLEPLLSVEDVAKLLGVSRAWVLSHAAGNRRPELPSVKLGKAVRFRAAQVEKFIEENTR